MPQVLQLKQLTRVQEGIVATLVFFGILEVPLTFEKIWQYLYKTSASKEQVKHELERLVERGIVRTSKSQYFSLKPVDEAALVANQQEVQMRWKRIDKFYWLLSLIPFVEQISVINSLSMGNAATDSDIDLFVITKPRRLYFVRTLIILIFKFLGIYKTKTKIKDQFCLGFYVTTDHLDLSSALIEGDDPHFAFWFASFIPLFGKRTYERMVSKNRWVYDYCPNFLPSQKVNDYQAQPETALFFKKILEAAFYIPAALLEPFFRYIHIRHTFRLPENHWPTATTIAEKEILKLHAIDPRRQVRERFLDILRHLAR